MAGEGGGGGMAKLKAERPVTQGGKSQKSQEPRLRSGLGQGGDEGFQVMRRH